ncbi:MAG: hypothetical protein IID37_03415 [Planctomycetes bacterium]|nr:hypothetical protein [Planctomycetota bacterium]
MSMKRRQLAMFALIIMTVAGGVAAQQPSRDRDRRGRRDRQRSTERTGSSPKAGEQAPPFTLKSVDGKQETNLASFRGKRPVILFFGSYT